MLADHHPVTHQKELQNTQTTPDNGQYNIERSEIRQICNSVPVNTDKPEEKCAQHTVHFIGAQDQSDAGSLTTQAPQSSSIRATINALSTWISAVQTRESWYLAGWIKDSPIDFLVDPGAVVSAIYYRINGCVNNSKHGHRLSLLGYYRTQHLSRHYWTPVAHLCVTLMTQFIQVRSCHHGICVLNERNCSGLHGLTNTPA